MKLVVFSICKDEAKTIGQVLDRIPKTIPGITEIGKLVISDGSTDSTAEVARKHGAEVIEGLSQKRLAFRFQQAIETTLEMGADIAVGIDGDLQFRPEDITRLVKPIVAEGYDFVHADRFTNSETSIRRKPKNMPAGKYLSNIIGSWIVSRLSKQRFSDVTCGFRAYNKKAMIALNISTGYTYTQESFQILALKRMDIKSVPIKVTYYPNRESRVVESFVKFLMGSAVNILRAFRDFAPLRFFGWFGFSLFTFGFVFLSWLGVHWLRFGTFTPYKFVGFVGIYLVTMAFLFWALGLVADMFSRSLNNQEKILEYTKKLYWEKQRKKK